MNKSLTRLLVYAHPLILLLLLIPAHTHKHFDLIVTAILSISVIFPLVLLVSAIVRPARFRFFAFLADLFVSIGLLLLMPSACS